MAVPSKVNLIGSEAFRATKSNGSFDWSLPASQALGRKISELVGSEKINIRIVQPGDNLGRIAEGLSQGAIRLQEEGGCGWESVTVIYRGGSSQIQQQLQDNPSRQLFKASLVFENQYIYLKDRSTLIVAANLQDLQPEVII